MQGLDILSLSMAAMATGLLLAVGMMLVGGVVGDLPAVRAWRAGALLFSASFLLLAMRHLAFDALVIAGNTALLAGATLLYRGFRLHFGLHDRAAWTFTGSALLAVLLALLTSAWPSAPARIALTSAWLGTLSIATAVTLVRHHVRAERVVAGFLSVCFGVAAALLLLRFASVAMDPVGADFLRDGSRLQAASLLTVCALNVCLAIGMTLLVTGRLGQSLRDSETRYRTVLDHAGDAVFVLDSAARVVYANAQAGALFGRPPSALVGRLADDFVAPHDLDALRAARKRLRAGGSDRDTLRVRRDDRAVIPVDVSAVRLPDGTYLAALRDVTERVRAEEALRQSEHRFRTLFESAAIAIVVIDARQGRLLQANRKAVEVHGLHGDGALGPPSFAPPPYGRRDAMRRIRTALAQGTQRFEWLGRLADGSTRWLDVLLEPVDLDGAQCVIAFASDISEQKRIARELERYRQHLEELVENRTRQLAEATERAEQASRAKSAFLANMSHEIRTPMNAIVGMAYLLRQDRATPSQMARLDTIDSAARHLTTIIDDVLDLSKIEAGRIELEDAPLAIDRLLLEVSQMLAGRAQEKSLRVSIDAPAAGLRLRGDATRLKQAMLNYAGNAIKFTERGEIALRARVVEDHGGDATVRFEVEDTGIGVAPDVLERLFVPFEQADASTTRRFGGTGLGLAITRRLAQRMGGAAGATSVPGLGSTFWFTAQLAKDTNSARPG